MTNWIIGAVIVVFIGRQVREKYLEQLRDDRPTTRRDLAHLAASAASDLPFGIASSAARLAFFVWLWDVTDGAAFSPFGWAGDAFGGTVWQPAIVALGLTEVVGRGGAMAVRAHRRKHAAYGEVPVPSA